VRSRGAPVSYSTVDSYVANAIGRGIRLVPPSRRAGARPDHQKVESLDTRMRCRVRPAQSCIGPDRFLWPANGDCLRSHGGRQVFRPLPAALGEGRTHCASPDNPSKGCRPRTQFEFQTDGRRAAYHFWKAHPGETMFFPMEALSVERVPATEVLHAYKPIRAGQFRVQPWLTSVIAKLYELEQYTDAEIVRQKLAAMITGSGVACKPSPAAPCSPSTRSAATCRGSTTLRSARAYWSSDASANSTSIPFSFSRSVTRSISAGCEWVSKFFGTGIWTNNLSG
jgi:hypothetical protein